MNQQVRYIIISPVRNEELFLEQTLASVASQTIPPTLWIIVDDGSTDRTGAIANAAERLHNWIRVVHRADRGIRKAGKGVMEAFESGMKLVGPEPWDYLVKLDGDVTFEADYFQRCFEQFNADTRLGIGGGLICNRVDGRLCAESMVDPVFHVRGATKIYKRECWQAIGGLVMMTGWDTIDEFKANMMGWTTRTFPSIKIVHHRTAGAAYGRWSNWLKNGEANYATGYAPWFMVLKCVSRFFQRPYGVAALGLWTGFCRGYVKRLPQVDDADLIRYIRREQRSRVLGQSSLWR